MYAVCDGEVESDWWMLVAGNGLDENEVGFAIPR